MFCFINRPSSIIRLCVVLAISFKNGIAQRDGLYPFVTVVDSQLKTNNQTTKMFSTVARITFESPETFKEAIFLKSAQSYYGQRSGLGGFLSISNIQFTDATRSPVTVSFDATYRYSELKSSIIDDERILKTIGLASVVKIGLEADADFKNRYNVSDDTNYFRFTGENLCNKVGCPQGNHMFCNEALQGVSGDCRSPCKVGYCNVGWCIHYHGNSLPVCSCPSASFIWYIGQHCEIYVHLWMPIIFFVGVFLILLLIIVVFCVLNRTKTIMQPKKTNTTKAITYDPAVPNVLNKDAINNKTTTVTQTTILKPREPVTIPGTHHNTTEDTNTIRQRHISFQHQNLRDPSHQSSSSSASAESSVHPLDIVVPSSESDSSSADGDDVDITSMTSPNLNGKHSWAGTAYDDDGVSESSTSAVSSIYSTHTPTLVPPNPQERYAEPQMFVSNEVEL